MLWNCFRWKSAEQRELIELQKALLAQGKLLMKELDDLNNAVTNLQTSVDKAIPILQSAENNTTSGIDPSLLPPITDALTQMAAKLNTAMTPPAPATGQ